jgi:hypothetical protein
MHRRAAAYMLREKLLSAAVKLPPSATYIAPPLQPGQPLPVLSKTVLCWRCNTKYIVEITKYSWYNVE